MNRTTATRSPSPLPLILTFYNETSLSVRVCSGKRIVLRFIGFMVQLLFGVYGYLFSIYMYIHTTKPHAQNKHYCTSCLHRDVLDNSIQRGGPVRSSLQALKRTDLNNSRRNSVHGYALSMYNHYFTQLKPYPFRHGCLCRKRHLSSPTFPSFCTLSCITLLF